MEALYINFTQRTRIGFVSGDAEGVQILKALAFLDTARCAMVGTFSDKEGFFLCGTAGETDFSSQMEDQLFAKFPSLPRAEGSVSEPNHSPEEE